MTAIEWTDVTWNPVRGCSRVSPGCDHCYAMRAAHRFSGPGMPYEGLTTIRNGKVDWSGVARFVPEALAAPLTWKKPRRVFVNSMSDLFHHSVTDEQIAAVFGVMAACPQHTFQVLTKRPERALEWLEIFDGDYMRAAGAADEAMIHCATGLNAKLYSHFDDEMGEPSLSWPLPNVWLGVSAENQKQADERVPILLACPAAVRFVSAEPLLGPLLLDNGESSWLSCNAPRPSEHCCEALDVGGDHFRGIDWVIVGGESGPGARPCGVAWIHSIVEQCRRSGVACFVKQFGSFVQRTGRQGEPTRVRLRDRKGGNPDEWSAAMRVREFPAQSGFQKGASRC